MAVIIDETFRPLTEKQIALLQYVCDGYENKQIAAAMGLAQTTVKTYLCLLFRQTHTKNRTDLAIWAVKNKLYGSSATPPMNPQPDGVLNLAS